MNNFEGAQKIRTNEADYLIKYLRVNGLPKSSNCREMKELLEDFIKTFQDRDEITMQMLYVEMSKLSTTA